MKRREFIKLSTGALTGLAIVQGGAASPQKYHQQTRLHGGTTVRVLIVVHPLDVEDRFTVQGHRAWVDLNYATGLYEFCSQLEPIYSHPMANWVTGSYDRVPEVHRTPEFPREKPILPDCWSWPELVEHYPEDGFLTQDIPRFVKVPMAKDILDFMIREERGLKDRRGDCPVFWADWDLATGAYEECAADDPIYDSALSQGVSAEYEKWNTIEMMSSEEIDALIASIRDRVGG
jgi:hypothetical protein